MCPSLTSLLPSTHLVGNQKKKNKETKKRSTQSSGVVVINFFTLSLHNKSKAICTNTIYAALTQVLKSKTKKIKKKRKKREKKIIKRKERRCLNA